MILRGEVYWADYRAAVGAEVRKTRPAVVVSRDAHNAHMGTVTVVPLSSSSGREFLFEVAIPAGTVGDGRACRAKTHQVGSVDKSRLGRRIGRLPSGVMRLINASLRLHLGL